MAGRRSSKLALLACGLVLTVVGRASAQRGELPVIVSYTAPAECATADAFQQLVVTQVAGERNPNRLWRFSVTIRHDGDYTGTLKTEGGTRELRAPTCDEITAAFATISVMAQPQLSAAGPSLPPPPAAPRTPVAAPLALSVVPVPATPATRRDETRMASPTLLGVGIAMATVGLAAIPFGVLHIVTADAASPGCPAAATCQPQGVDGTAMAIIGAGAGLAVGGLVMSVLGLHRKHFSVEGGPIGSTGAAVAVTF